MLSVNCFNYFSQSIIGHFALMKIFNGFFVENMWNKSIGDKRTAGL